LPQAQVEAFKAQQGLPQGFILFIGTIEPRKNVAALIKAYAAWRRRAGQAPKLIIGGGKGWYYGQVFALVESLGLRDDVIFPGYLPQADLPMWYNAATIFVYPSLFEGFGLPVLEAMACGTPVITSKASSLPEVAGEAGMLVDPTDVDNLSYALERVFNDLTLRDSMRQKGLAQSAKFSWHKAATETLEVYQRTLAHL
jgi:glycosyltransferase involved in cell wall biosynthesis